MALRGISIDAASQTIPSPTFTGTVTFPDGSTWTSTAITITNPTMKYGTTGLVLNPQTIASAPADVTANAIHIIGNANNRHIQVDANSGPNVNLTRTPGTFASPTGLVANNLMGSFTGGGWDTAAIASGAAAVQMFSTQTWSASAHGTKIILATTPNGSTTLTSALTIDNDGTVAWAVVYTIATLPAAALAIARTRTFVSDGVSNLVGVAVTITGAVMMPVYSDGVAWRYG